MRRGEPRTSQYLGVKEEPWYESFGTWLEPESICYPQAGFTRRAKVLHPDGKLRILRTSVADTYFSLPVRPDTGFITKYELGDGRAVWLFLPYDDSPGISASIEAIAKKAIALWRKHYDHQRY